MSEFVGSLGSLGFAYRMRRLSERMQEGARRLYDGLEVPLETNWFTLLLYLDARESASVTEVAEALGVSHPAIVDVARRVESAGLIEARPDPGDGRRRVLKLTPRGMELLPEFKSLWVTVSDELDEVIEATAGGDALSALASIDSQLDAEELDVRVRRRLDRVAETAEPAPTRPIVSVRAAVDSDRDAVVHIARELVRAADTYAYDPATSDDELWRYWHPHGPGDGYVAVLDTAVVGMFVIRPNHPGPGAHVANASYAVRADVRGVGLGRQMGDASLDIARASGYRAMQFNAVVSTNTHAVRLWRSLGFRIVGTIPDGFRLPDGSFVSHHIMYRALS